MFFISGHQSQCSTAWGLHTKGKTFFYPIYKKTPMACMAYFQRMDLKFHSNGTNGTNGTNETNGTNGTNGTMWEYAQIW